MKTYAEEEARARRISGALTLLMLLTLFILAYFWVLVRGTIPPEDENTYTIAGRIDFGPTETVGSVKSLRSPSPSSSVITTPQPAPVQMPSTPASPEPLTPPSPAETPESSEEEEEETELFQPTGGSPKAASEGDLGAGLLEFGEGDEGTENRRLIHFVAPRYTVQKEARVRFELFVLPDGSVSHARALELQAPPELKRAGEEAILQWRFTPIHRNQIQRMTVTIRFKLR
ncbi:MAG: energy transducer TonB [Bacteroidia bacterium]|nr:energy transducer TonB [Bacteroidia bacterium]MDW8015981.1 energy transducer TonB [Bacteroidia bacterium]